MATKKRKTRATAQVETPKFFRVNLGKEPALAQWLEELASREYLTIEEVAKKILRSAAHLKPTHERHVV